MNEVKIFENPEFGKVRTMVINGYERVFTTTYVTQKGLDYILKLSKYYEKE